MVGILVSIDATIGATNDALLIQIPHVEDLPLGQDDDPTDGLEVLKKFGSEQVQSAMYESAVRWKRVIDGLPRVKIGISRDQVVEILGEPDKNGSIPGNVMQYSVFGTIRPVGDDGRYVMVKLDDRGRVTEISRVEYSYGALEEPLPLTPASRIYWTPRIRKQTWKSAMSWKQVLDNLPKVRKGLTRREVIAILGEPDTYPGIPTNVLQYDKLSLSTRPRAKDGKCRPVVMEFDSSGKLVSVTRPEIPFFPSIRDCK
jgi:outer membrane protein assembly factor BamE (lipoprotein component of BamABCDE complex)